MTDTLLSNVLPYSAQVALIVALGALLPALVGLGPAGVRYAYFRGLLALCLVLPWLQGRQEATADGNVVSTSMQVAAVALAPPGPAPSAFSWSGLAAVVLLTGVAVRLGWIGAGLIRLRRLRRTGRAADPGGTAEALQALVGTRAEIRYVPGRGQPVTFGVRVPVVLLPESLAACPAHVQTAVLCHELWHVRRRDWLWLLAEEVVRAVLWFHPAVWWLVSRVQLAREEVVDELTVLATGNRRGYAEALMTFADERPLVFAAAFGRRRHLFRRVRLVLKEAAMSSTRVVVSGVAAAILVAGGVWLAVDVFPLASIVSAQELLEAPGPLERQARPITPENPVPRRVYSVEPFYPDQARAAGVNVTVGLIVTIDPSGRVGEVRRLGVSRTPQAADQPFGADDVTDALVKSAADAVRQWQYAPPADGPIAIQINYLFEPGAEPRLALHAPQSGRIIGSDGRLVPVPVAPRGAGVLSFTRGRGRGFEVTAGEVPPAPAWAEGALRVGQNIRPPAKITDVRPAYPAVAQTARVQGVVIIEARIGEDGRVTNARVLRSIPLLDQAALEAVAQWEFEPTLLNGKPVPIIMTVTVNFTLS